MPDFEKPSTPEKKGLIEEITYIGKNKRLESDKPEVAEMRRNIKLPSQEDVAFMRVANITLADKEKNKTTAEKPVEASGKKSKYSKEEQEEMYDPENWKPPVVAEPDAPKADEEGHPYKKEKRPYTEEEEREIYGKESLETKEKTEEGGKSSEAEKPEKTKQEILSEAREKFVRAELNATQQLSILERLHVQKNLEGVEGYKQAREEYLKAMGDVRAEMLDKYSKEMGVGLKGKQQEEWLKGRTEEILKETVVREANNIYDTKMRLKLEAKGDNNFADKAWKTAGRAVEAYRKWPTKYKWMLSAGLLGGGLATGAMVGATGAALATGIVAGRWFQRVFGGAALAVGTERAMHGVQERRAEKKTLKELGGKLTAEQFEKLSGNLKDNNKALDERLLQLAGAKGKEKWSRYIVAGTLGGLVMSGYAGKAIRFGFGEIDERIGIGHFAKEKFPWLASLLQEHPSSSGGGVAAPEAGAPSGHLPETGMTQGQAPETGTSYDHPAELIGHIETAGKGDSVWKLAERQLEHLKEFNELDPARKIYAIDAIKDKIAADPRAFGLENADKVKIGQKIDFSSVFKDEQGINKIFDSARKLAKAQLENILHHSEKAGRILGGHTGIETPHGAGAVAQNIPETDISQAPVPEQPSSELPVTDAQHDIPPQAETPKPNSPRFSQADYERGKGVFGRWGGHAEGTLGTNPLEDVHHSEPPVPEAHHDIPSHTETSGIDDIRNRANAFFEEHDRGQKALDALTDNDKTFSEKIDAFKSEFHEGELIKYNGAEFLQKDGKIIARIGDSGAYEELNKDSINKYTKYLKIFSHSETPAHTEIPTQTGITPDKATEAFMAENVANTLKSLGFQPDEYEIIKNLKVGNYLDAFTGDRQTFGEWQKGGLIPHFGEPDFAEFEKQMKLAEFIDKYHPTKEMMGKTIGEVLKRYL